MKRILTVICLLLSAVALNAQVTEHNARTQHEQALEQMAYFTLTKDVRFYHQGMALLKSTKLMYDMLNKHSISNNLDAVRFETKSKLLEVELSTYNDSFFDRIINDRSSTGSKVRFKEKAYAVSSERQQILTDLVKAMKSAQLE
jgi:hypothetical protein